jgi:hypothetical protein
VKAAIVTAVAQGEIDSAAAWYENRKEGLGAEFLDRVAETFERIETNPEGYVEATEASGVQTLNSSHLDFGSGLCRIGAW